MTRTRLAVTLAAASLALAGCGGDGDGDGDGAATGGETTAASGGGGAVTGTVGPGFDISMTGADGLAPGAVTITVTDNASSHNFHLTGPGVDVQTDVGGEGEESFDVTLEPGEYTFLCDPHASSMNGSFTVQ